MGFGPAARLFILGFLKILALLMAFFFLDREHRSPRKQEGKRNNILRWIQWPIVTSLLVACGAEGYDAYLKYTDAKDTTEKTDRLLSSIERSSHPLFPLTVEGTYVLNLTDAPYAPLMNSKVTFLESDDAVAPGRLPKAAAKTLDWRTAALFNTTIDTYLFFFKESGPGPTIQDFISRDFPEKRIALSLELQATPTSCGEAGKNAIIVPCELKDNVLSIPLRQSSFERFSHGTYIHGPVQFYSDLVGTTLIVRSCISEPPVPHIPRQVIGKLNAPLKIQELIMIIAGGDTFRLLKPTEAFVGDGCSYSKYAFGTTPEELEKQLDPY